MQIPPSLRNRHREWIEAVNNRDIDAYALLLSRDAVWMPPGQDPIIGREAFKQWLEPFFDVFSYDFSISKEQFIVSGNWAFEKAAFLSNMTSLENGQEMSHAGSFIVLWNRKDDNKWYIDRYIDITDTVNP